MKIPHQLLIFFFTGLLQDVIPSNPDSEIVQDSSKEIKRTEAKSAPIRSPESQPRRSVLMDRYSGVTNVRVLRPFISGSEIVWREVETSQGSGRLNIRNPSSFLDLWRGERNKGAFSQNRPGVSVAVPQSSSSADVGSNGDVTKISSSESSNNPNGEIVNDRPFSPQIPRGQENKNNEKEASGAQGFQPNSNGQNNRGTSVYGGKTPLNPEMGGNANDNFGGSRIPPVQPNIRGGASPNAPGNVGTSNNRRISPDSNFFAGIVNNFAFKLVETLNLESNFVISPLSIFIALSMCYLGSDGRTKSQLERALDLNDNAIHGTHLHQGIADLLSLVSPDSSQYQLFSANAMFLQQNFTAEESFKEDIEKFYGAQLINVNFRENPLLGLSVINEWVAKSTRGMIPSLVDIPLPRITRLVLMNAIYFKGIWKTQFPLNLTFNGRFFSSSENVKEVPFMTLRGHKFPLYRSDEHQHSFIKLPYEGDQVSMIIALPYTRQGEPMPSVNDQTLCYVLDAMAETQLDTVAIPKFRLEFTRSLRRALNQLGIRDLFRAAAVNMTHLRRQNDVTVSAVVHKAVVEVNEEGTTAAAITEVRFVPLSMRNTTDFVASHPFAFYIVHEPSGLVLFYGKIYDFEATADAPPSGNVNGAQGSRRKIADRPTPPAYKDASRVRIHGAVIYADNK